MAFVVSSLPDYVEQNRIPLIKDIVLGGKTIERMQHQLGVKKDAALNILSLSPALQAGGCGFNASGDATFTQRVINTGEIKVNMTLCPDTLLGKWNEWAVRVGANPDALPFEAEVVDLLIRNINKKMEKAVWQGDTTSSDTDLKWFNGLLKVLTTASAPTVSIASGKSTYEAVAAVYAAIPEEAYAMGKVKISCDPAIFRAFVQDLVAKNYYHYNPADGLGTILFPGSDVEILPAEGLANTKKLVASADENLVYGCDLIDAKEEVKIIWSEDDIYKIKVKWNSGVQVAFPAYTVTGTMAAAPVALDAYAGIKTSIDAATTALGGIKTGTDKVAGCVNSDNQLETKANS